MPRKPPPFDLGAKFRAISQELRGHYEGARIGGKHSAEKGLRYEGVLRDFLARHLPPRYGISRGEIVSFAGEVSNQIDLVIYDAVHAPLLQEADASHVFAAESVYAAIEVKTILQPVKVQAVVANIASAKVLDRTAIVAEHGGHQVYHGPRTNPPIFGAVFAYDGGDVRDGILPRLHEVHARYPRQCWVDCICILDKALIYHFVPGEAEGDFSPGFLGPDTALGYYESGPDTLLLFYLFLMAQLNARDLFPPDLHRYARTFTPPPAHVYVPSARRRFP